MGRKGDETRGRLLDATRDLMESSGYFGAGLNQVIAASGAPKGSLYFHFPGGKDQLVGESVSRAGREIAAAINGIQAPDAVGLVDRLLDLLGSRMAESDWRKGCPVATVALEVSASNDVVQQACSAAYSSWEQALRDQLAMDRHPDAEGLATTILALIEGSILLARTHRSLEPLARVRRTVRALL